MEALVMVVNRDRQHLLCMVLADNMVVENRADFLRRRNAVARFAEGGFFLVDDILAQLDAFVADEHRRARDELAHLMLALAAEPAIEGMLRIVAGDLIHPCFPMCSMTIEVAGISVEAGCKFG